MTTEAAEGLMTNYASTYWADPIEGNIYTSGVSYKVYKGKFPDKSAPIITCTEERPCLKKVAHPFNLKFTGTQTADLTNTTESTCGQMMHRLVAPDVVGNRILSEIKSERKVCGGWMPLVASPYFKSVDGFKTNRKVYMFVFVAIMVLLCTASTMLTYMVVDKDKDKDKSKKSKSIILMVSIIGILLLIFTIGLLIIVFASRWGYGSEGSRRKRLLELVGIANDAKYADVDYVWESFCSTRICFEFNFVREPDQVELLTMISAAIISDYAAYE